MKPLFTIGHSTHDFSTFLALLTQHEVSVVADVRSRPFSRFPWFCREVFERELKANHIRYVFLGAELGARREEPECYIGRRADYSLIAQTDAYRRGIERLRNGVASYRVTLMCSEHEPLDCHRTILVCRHAKEFADIHHIRADGRLESHADIEARLLGKYFSRNHDLFRNENEMLEEAYLRRAQEINYIDDSKPLIEAPESLNHELI